jgi:hypothetical protein
MAKDGLQQRFEALESKVQELESQSTLKSREMAYLYIHSNWTLIAGA